jgi:hypothetical protein
MAVSKPLVSTDNTVTVRIIYLKLWHSKACQREQSMISPFRMQNKHGCSILQEYSIETSHALEKPFCRNCLIVVVCRVAVVHGYELVGSL